jgi:hypothetical protein
MALLLIALSIIHEFSQSASKERKMAWLEREQINSNSLSSLIRLPFKFKNTEKIL